MTPIFIFCNWLFEYFLVGYVGITLYPFIIIYENHWKPLHHTAKARLITHELEHFRQQEEDGVIPFYWTYLNDYLKNKKKGQSEHNAYWNIPYELEARESADKYWESEKKFQKTNN